MNALTLHDCVVVDETNRMTNFKFTCGQVFKYTLVLK